MVRVVLDSDFLSSFLKIDQLHRARDYFEAEVLHLPTAVFREVSVTRLLSRMTRIPWLEIHEISDEMLDEVNDKGPPELNRLGDGEREAIALAFHWEQAVLLMNDKKALRAAASLGITTVNIPAFLGMYKAMSPQAASRVPELIKALEEEDHFGFPPKLRKSLLK